jgi:hypothetical protein
MQPLGRACDAPQDICMTFGTTADSLIQHGHARRVGQTEGLDLLQQAREGDLVQFGENVQRHVSFICNCCGCCCEAMLSLRRPVHDQLPARGDSRPLRAAMCRRLSGGGVEPGRRVDRRQAPAGGCRR